MPDATLTGICEVAVRRHRSWRLTLKPLDWPQGGTGTERFCCRPPVPREGEPFSRRVSWIDAWAKGEHVFAGQRRAANGGGEAGAEWCLGSRLSKPRELGPSLLERATSKAGDAAGLVRATPKTESLKLPAHGVERSRSLPVKLVSRLKLQVVA